MSADPFISVHEGMILNQTKAETGGFLLDGGIDIFSAEGLERRIQCGVQHPLVTQTGRAYGRFQKLFMQQEDLRFGKPDHW